MQVLKDRAAQLDVHLQVASQLDGNLLNGLRLGLAGEHQYVNAGLAIMVSSTWLQRTGHPEFKSIDQTSSLPEQFIKGLTTASLQGRAITSLSAITSVTFMNQRNMIQCAIEELSAITSVTFMNQRKDKEVRRRT